MYNYTAYGLSIRSDVALPELLASAETATDVVIKVGKLASLPREATHELDSFRYRLSPDEAYFFWDPTAAFLVRGGKEIIVDPSPEAEESLIRVLLLGVIFSVLLHQRGLLVLHASAVVINGGAVAFLGGKGWGKSTMAAMLYSRGHLHLADDLVALRANGASSPVALSGYPQLKLWPEAAAFSLGEDPALMARVTPRFEKRARRTADRFSAGEIPLCGLYILSGGPEPELKMLKPQQAVVQLIANSYAVRFGDRLLNGAVASRHLRQCASIAGRVPIYQLARPDRLDLLPAIAEMLEYNLGCGSSDPAADQMRVTVGM